LATAFILRVLASNLVARHSARIESFGDKEMDEPNADRQIDNSRVEQLVAVNRELGIFLEEQLDAMLALRQSVAAIQKVLEGNSAMKKKYEKCLQSVKDDGEGLPDIHWANRIRGVLARLQRTGTL
jgi:hypothetical protein